MSEAVIHLLPLLDKLSDAECTEVIQYLIDRVPPPDELDDEAFLENLHRRGRDIADGTAKLIPSDEFFEELRRKY